MGWCSGTDVFDPVVKEILKIKELSDNKKKHLIRTLIFALEDKDWDCQNESHYWNNRIVRSVFKEEYPEWFDDI